MNAQFDSNGLPICPDCGYSLYCDDVGDRDTETMGGYSVEYYYCTNCQTKFEIVRGIEDSIYPSNVVKMNLYSITLDNGEEWAEDHNEGFCVVLANNKIEAEKICFQSNSYRWKGWSADVNLIAENVSWPDMPETPCCLT